MPIAAGELNQRVQLYRTDFSRGDGGASIQGRTLVATVWAKVEAGGGTQADRGGGELARQGTLITIRKRADVAPTWEVDYRGRTYQVENVAEPFDGLNEYLILTAYADEVAAE